MYGKRQTTDGVDKARCVLLRPWNNTVATTVTLTGQTQHTQRKYRKTANGST